MKKLKAIILRNELNHDHDLWEQACYSFKDYIDYRVVNLILSNWLEEIQNGPFDILLAKPGGLTAPFKQLYDERIFILGMTLEYKIFPSLLEIFIYENKRFLSYWLKANNIPHPETQVYYSSTEAMEFVGKTKYPLIAKSNIGASGSGVIILYNRKEASNYIKETFFGKGAKKRTGPNFGMGGLVKRGLHYLAHPNDIQKKIMIYKSVGSDIQSGFVILQTYIEHEFEWRVVRIGNSFFAHKKLKIGEKASGALIKNYDDPPIALFDFVKEITDRHRFYSLAVDIFESERGYLVNEMQCIFGQSDPYQMLVGGKIGRYVYSNDNWVFEEGDFVKHECFDLRIEHILKSI
jgi:hypothetical protein